MTKILKLIALLAFIVLIQTSAKAQFFVKYQIGFSEYDVEIKGFGDNRYGNIVPSFLNLGLQYHSENSRWNLKIRTQTAQLNPKIEEMDYFDGTHKVDYSELEYGLEYLRRIDDNSNKKSPAFLGLSYTGRLSSYSNRIKSDYMESNWDYEEFVLMDLSIIGATEYRFNENLVGVKVGLGVLNYRFINEDYWTLEDNFFGIGPGFIVQFQNEIYVQLPISKRIFIKPEYSFKYHKYRPYAEMKALQQHFLIGGVVQL